MDTQHHDDFNPQSIYDIDDWISFVQRKLSALPRFQYHRHPACVQDLAMLHSMRYGYSGQKGDLDRSILHFTQVILISPAWIGPRRNIVHIFFSLAFELFRRSQEFKRPRDVKACILYFNYLRNQLLEAFGIERNRVKSLLLVALAIQVEVGSDDVMGDIDEMADLSRELLKSGISEGPPIQFLEALCNMACINSVSAKLVECLMEATRRLDSHQFPLALGYHRYYRFLETRSIHDYKEAITLLDNVIASHSHGECQGSCVEVASSLAVELSVEQFGISGKPEYEEEAIRHCRTFLDIASTDHPKHDMFYGYLVHLRKERSRHFGITEDFQEPYPWESGVVPSFSHLAASLAKSCADKPHSMSPEEDSQHVQVLMFAYYATDIIIIEEAIKYCRSSLDSFSRHGVAALVTPFVLGKLLYTAFKHNNKSEYLNESISLLRDVLKTPGLLFGSVRVVRLLIPALTLRFLQSFSMEDFEETMQLFPIAVNDTGFRVPDRFMFACDWAKVGRAYKHPVTSTAYESASQLVQDALLFAPTLETQHFSLVALRNCYEEFPLDYASYRVSKNQLMQAIEVLEQGRALLWSEMRGFRTSVIQLQVVDSRLAEEFVAVNRELRELTTEGVLEDNDNVKKMDPFGRLVVQQRKLLASRVELVSRINALPGFENFLKTQSFDALRSAAVGGPVIILNHSRWRCDVLILLHDTHPSLITTANEFYDRAIEWKNELVLTRKKHGLASMEYQCSLQLILEGLYKLLGKAVINELRRLKIREQSRIWWCPTSVLCYLPLHAMGPIPSNDGAVRYFSDLYIPSYTTTLSALIVSRRPGNPSSEKPSILLLANPDSTLKQAPREISRVQRIETKVTTLWGRRATRPAVLRHLQKHQFAHFVCHGILEQENPFNSSFKLYGGHRLKLLDIVQSRLPAAEFAFLSACHTAELTEGSIAGEGLHLAAAVQHCGFRSVVGTMWAMADEDGAPVAESFYESIFSSDDTGVPYYERSARAIRDAARVLREKKKVPLERWVNYVHYGA